MRSGGSIDRLISERVRDSRFKPATIRLYIDSSTCDVQSTLSPSRSRRRANMVRGANREDSQTIQWLDRGLVGWMTAAASRMVFDEPIGTCNSSQTTSGITTDWLYACGSAWSMMRPGDWLFHCVRGRTMGHCDTQAAHSVIDAVLRQHAREVSAYEVLLEIVRSKRLRGRKTLFRASSPCVSFSAVPLEELLRRRAYQSHLQRWDWEPYGLAVRRSALVALGTRPVIYGDEDDYSRLDESDRPFFQPAQRRQSNKRQANKRKLIDVNPLSDKPIGVRSKSGDWWVTCRLRDCLAKRSCCLLPMNWKANDCLLTVRGELLGCSRRKLVSGQAR